MFSDKLKNVDVNAILIFTLFSYVLFLPIAKVTAIQNILYVFFVFVCIYTYYKSFDYKNFFKLKVFFILFGGLLFLATCSYFYSIDSYKTFSEIRSEFLKPLILFLLVYFFIAVLEKEKLQQLFFLLGCVLVFHAILNIGIWIDNGGWPSRTGGLLDGTIVALNISNSAERFGIWATYFLSFALGLTFTKHKRMAYLFIIIALISIIANHTRATFIGTILIFLAYFIFLYKNKLIKIFSLSLIVLSILFFSIYSKNFGERFNIYNMVSSLKYLNDYTPSQFKILEDNYELGFSTVTRWAMWKSVILYRIDEPFIPQSYGRFLYGKSLSEIYKDKKENIPYVLFSQAHSDFMSMLFSLGIFGLILFLLLLGYTLRISYLLTKDENYKSFGVLVFLGTFGYIGSMMFGSFFGDTEQMFFYILLGTTLSIYIGRLNEHKTNQSK